MIIPIAIAVATFVIAFIGRSGIPSIERAARLKVAVSHLDSVRIIGQTGELIKPVGIRRNAFIEIAIAIIKFNDNAFNAWLACILKTIHDVILIVIEIMPDIVANDAIALAIRPVHVPIVPHGVVQIAVVRPISCVSAACTGHRQQQCKNHQRQQ